MVLSYTSMVLSTKSSFPGGYATINGSSFTFHYYTQDYLGNNRAVINGSTGAIEQTVAYYPYGGVIADLGTNQTSGQPYKFGGKELITANGLNEYDFGARQYYSAVPGFTSIDPLCEKYYWLSPYLYCGNNPVNFFDPDGKQWENKEDSDKLNYAVRVRISEVMNQMVSLTINISENSSSWSSEQISEQKSVLDDLSSQLSILSRTLSDINMLGSDKRTYVLDDHPLGGEHHVSRSKDGKIHIQASSEALAGHEITHISQSLSEGKVRFKRGLMVFNRNTPKKLTEYECEAYRVQYSIDPLTMPVSIDKVMGIDANYLKSIRYPGSRQRVYPFAR